MPSTVQDVPSQVLSGWSLEESGVINKESHALLEWHETFGILTLCLTFLTVIMKNVVSLRNLYLCSLGLLVLSVIITSHLGGLMAFEGFDLVPPTFKV